MKDFVLIGILPVIICFLLTLKFFNSNTTEVIHSYSFDVTSDGANVRTSASISDNIDTVVTKGARFYIVDTSLNKWISLLVNGDTLYIAKSVGEITDSTTFIEGDIRKTKFQKLYRNSLITLSIISVLWLWLWYAPFNPKDIKLNRVYKVEIYNDESRFWF